MMDGVKISMTAAAPSNKYSLFLVQDPDAPYFVIARDYGEAIQKWKQRIVDDSEGNESMLDPKLVPQGIALVAEPDELIR